MTFMGEANSQASAAGKSRLVSHSAPAMAKAQISGTRTAPSIRPNSVSLIAASKTIAQSLREARELQR